MRKPSVKCALLAAMIAKHRWGSPIVEEDLPSISAIETNDYSCSVECVVGETRDSSEQAT